MVKNEKVTRFIDDNEWSKILQELIRSGITKEEFKQFIEQKRVEKNLS